MDTSTKKENVKEKKKDQFLEWYKLPKVTQEIKENVDRPISSKEIE